MQDNLTQEVAHISTVSYLEGSIQTIEALHKSFSTFKEIGMVPVNMVLDSLDTLKKDQNERLEGIKKIHEENKRDTF
jgi:hypothetical protein